MNIFALIYLGYIYYLPWKIILFPWLSNSHVMLGFGWLKLCDLFASILNSRLILLIFFCNLRDWYSPWHKSIFCTTLMNFSSINYWNRPPKIWKLMALYSMKIIFVILTYRFKQFFNFELSCWNNFWWIRNWTTTFTY